MNKKNLIQLSRTVSHALRHAPEEYGLQLDSSGWIEMSDLSSALEKTKERWKGLTNEDFYLMASAGEKQRFEFSGSRIRAIYGHSFAEPVEYEEDTPPDLLFHGTTQEVAVLILKDGLKPMKRQYVHLSPDLETATQVALRRTSAPKILRVDAKAAYENGIKFYRGNDNVWLAKYIHSQFIST
ncbi:MAG: RNA 2'-phosphotransferase [Ketobacter sp.]|nr:RNA 2'-phosphotransferase [Ketobacter sp.]